MDNNEVKAIVKSEIKNFVADSLDKEIKKILHNSNSLSRDEVLNTMKNALDSVYKLLWMKKEFWKADIK
jgi:hypothetical protein